MLPEVHTEMHGPDMAADLAPCTGLSVAGSNNASITHGNSLPVDSSTFPFHMDMRMPLPQQTLHHGPSGLCGDFLLVNNNMSDDELASMVSGKRLQQQPQHGEYGEGSCNSGLLNGAALASLHSSLQSNQLGARTPLLRPAVPPLVEGMTGSANIASLSADDIKLCNAITKGIGCGTVKDAMSVAWGYDNRAEMGPGGYLAAITEAEAVGMTPQQSLDQYLRQRPGEHSPLASALAALQTSIQGELPISAGLSHAGSLSSQFQTASGPRNMELCNTVPAASVCGVRSASSTAEAHLAAAALLQANAQLRLHTSTISPNALQQAARMEAGGLGSITEAGDKRSSVQARTSPKKRKLREAVWKQPHLCLPATSLETAMLGGEVSSGSRSLVLQSSSHGHSKVQQPQEREHSDCVSQGTGQAPHQKPTRQNCARPGDLLQQREANRLKGRSRKDGSHSWSAGETRGTSAKVSLEAQLKELAEEWKGASTLHCLDLTALPTALRPASADTRFY